MSGIEVEDIEIDQPRQLTDRQLTSLVSLWRLSHYKQAPWSTWSILYTKRRPKRSTAPVLCFDTTTYNILRQQQDEDFRKKQFHQHQIWQHVQDRLAEQNKILEQEKVKQPKTQSKGNQLLHISPAEALEESTAMEVTVSDIASPDLSISSSSSSSTVTSGSCSPELNPTKRSIRWGLQNNMIKRFDKTSPITLVTVPAIDKRPSKSALKVRTSNIIQKQSFKTTKTTTTTTTTTTATTTSTNNTKTANNTKNGFPSRKRAADFF